MKFFIFFLQICLFFSLNAQTVTVSGIINNYASVNSIGSQSVNVSSTIGFNIGDKVLLIQMKGATIDTTNTLNFGTIASYNDAGNYEMLSIANISSTAISFTTPLLRTYNASGFVQLVKVPVYNNVNVIGLLTCSPWNGSTGGVLAFEASGNVTLNANIDITGKGFLGGGNVLGQFFSCSGNTTDYKLPTSSLASAFKGEGITNTHSTYSKGLGALANGGGAGNDVNGGGAGGGNYGLGGHGGNSICSSNPISFCGGNNGKNCVYSNSNNKIFLGGGGGAGHQNDGVGTGGVSGGGIILIRCLSLIGNNNFIKADGNNNTAIAGNDGQGGGGAGGTILIDACSSSSLTISAKGGFGGIDNYIGASCHGKGGGGGGGIIWTSSPLIYSSVLTGGLPGVFTSGSSPCFNTSNGATTGQVGGTLSGLIIPGVISSIASSGTFSLGISTICVNNNNSNAIATITTNISSPIISYTWTNSSNTIISQTNNSSSLTNTVTNLTNDIYTLLAQINAPCGPIISQTININCIISPTTTALFSSPDTVCVNQSFSVTNLSTGTNSNYWTFCQGNTNLTPQAINLGNIGFFNGPVFITIAKEGTDYYAFVTNNTFGALTKLFFGSSLLNAPVATNLGNVSGAFPSSLEDIHIQYESGNWYGIAVGGLGGSETVIRINFGSSLANTPTAISMGNIGGLNYPQRLKIFNNGGNYYGFTTNRNNNTITRLNFGNSIANTPTGLNMGNIGALNTPDAIALVNVSALWYGYIINEGNNTLSRLDFGNSLLNIPIGTNLGNTGALNGPRGIDMWTECNEVRGLITNRFSNDLLNMNLSSGPTGPVITTSFGNIANFSFPHSITRFRSGDTLFAFITNVSNNTLSRIYYPGCINSSIPSSTLTTPPNISYNAPGNYYINLLVNEGQISQTNYCKQITVVNSPTIIVSNYNNCIGIPTNISATGATTYTWNTGANTNSITVSPSTTTSYTVTGAIGTCSNSAVSTVSVIPSPTITLTPTLSLICSGQTASLTASGANTYTWTPNTTLSSNTGSMVTSTPSATIIYTVTGTANTCTNSAITTVSILPSPTITLSPNTSICQGSGTSATLTANGASSYTWNSAANLSSATGSIVTANPNSTETYTVIGSLNSCTNTAVTTVSVIATPTLSINSSSATICPIGSASLTATGATNYTWSPISTLSSSSGSLVIASPNTTTTYTVLGSNGTCTNTAQVQSIITVTNNPVITSSNATICSSTSDNLSANGGVTYTWTPSTNLNATTGSNVISTPTASIVYTVSGSSALGCIGSTSVSITVIPTPTLTISSNSLNLCIVGQSSALTANGATSYTWSPTTTINSINTNTTIATPVNTTIYTVIGSNGFTPNICSSTQTIQINVGASSIPTVSPNDEICFGQSTTIYAIGGNTYHWSPTTGVYKPNDSTTLVKPNVTTIYTVTVSKNNICPVTATIQVIVDPLPIVDAGKDSTINIDQDIVLTGTGNVNVGFLSPDGNPLICNWCPIVTVHPLESTCYTLEGFNTYGCRNTDVVCITVTKEWDVFIPNAFTPNGDISNDYFIPKGYGIAQIDLSIFDRWGVCIFKETNTTLGWDGKYKGQLCQQGIYVYQVDIKAMSGENTTKTGHVTLLSKLK